MGRMSWKKNYCFTVLYFVEIWITYSMILANIFHAILSSWHFVFWLCIFLLNGCLIRSIISRCFMLTVTIQYELWDGCKFLYRHPAMVLWSLLFLLMNSTFCAENAPALWSASRKRRRLRIAIWISGLQMDHHSTAYSLWPFVVPCYSDWWNVWLCVTLIRDYCIIFLLLVDA